MARRRILLSLVIAAIAMLTARAQYPSRNIPPTYVPQTEEPALADQTKAAELPEKLRATAIGAVPNSGAASAPGVSAAPVSLDPPTPFVSIQVNAPASTSAGADIEYKIVVENKSQAAAHHVRVTFPIPAGAQPQMLEPPVASENTQKLLAWQLGTLKPGESRTIRVSLRPKQEGLESLEATARVQFEHGQKVRTVLHRPQLAIRKITNQHALQKEDIVCKLIVENTGAVDVLNINVFENLSEGLDFGEKEFAGKPVRQWTIPSLGPKQSKEFTYTVVGAKTGALTSKIEARGERGARAEHNWKIDVGPSPVTLKITGPPKIYLNYPAKYDIEVAHGGAGLLDNVVVAFNLPKGMKVIRSTPGSQSFEDRLQWTLPKLSPGEKRSFSVWAQMHVAGTVPNFAQVLWRGPKQVAEVATEFVGATALHLDLRESHDPARVGDKVRYTLTVNNRGTAAAKDVKLYVKYPLTQFALDVDGSDGETRKNDNVQVIALDAIPPKGSVSRQITLKATAAGKAIFHVEMESPDLPAGNVTKEEPTTITE